MQSTVLVVEDEPAIQELLAAHMVHAGHRVLRALDANEAQACMRDELPDIVLLDWMLPGRSGLEFARTLRTSARTKDVPIIMLTARGVEQDKVAALEAGADDYVTKPFSPRELMARIKAVLRRRAPHATADAIEIAGLRLDPGSHEVTRGTTRINLGPTEFRLLHFFMTHPDRVYNRAQLLDAVWGDHVFIEERTVDVHIRRLRSALNSTGYDVLLETVRSAGYRFVPPR